VKRAFNERRDDAEVTKLIHLVMRERPTYGYKRITAMVNARYHRKFNRKRIYRLMRKAGRLLPRPPPARPKHPGTGKVMVAHPNTRWASDCFEIHCWNDEKVYVTFAIDCCDREVIHFIATSEDTKAEVVQALMFRCVEISFGVLRAPRQLEWLTDRGSIYKSKETQQVARDLNLKPCFTAAYSPAQRRRRSFRRDRQARLRVHEPLRLGRDRNEGAPPAGSRTTTNTLRMPPSPCGAHGSIRRRST
jgi:putative transposase